METKHDPLDDLFLKPGEPEPSPPQHFKKTIPDKIADKYCFRCNRNSKLQCWKYWSVKEGKHRIASWCSEDCLNIVEHNPNIRYDDIRHKHRGVNAICAGEKAE